MRFEHGILRRTCLALTLTSLFCSSAFATNDAARLSQDLTPVGATRAASADGRIPAWTGGLKQAPKDYQAGTHLVDPFADEKPLYRITPDNLDKYRDQLSPGQIAMFEKYPETYRMDIYPTHRTASLPDFVYAAIAGNAETARLIEGGNGVTDWQEAIPFPVPESGLEVIWNHITRYRGQSLSRDIVQGVVQRNGSASIIKFSEQAVSGFHAQGNAQEGDDNVLIFFKQQVTAPARMTGNVLLIHETINQTLEPRKAWLYNAGQRRVRRAPQVAYDGPGTAADGLRTADNFDLYSGAPDRYDWALKGVRELYIPYNNYALASSAHRYDDMLEAGHLNRDLVRYERHRVWEVEATLKEGARHIYSKRVFYIDEDTWQIAVVDHYDGRGDIWRVAEGFMVQYYYAQTPLYVAEAIHDLSAERYLVLGLHNEESRPPQFGVEINRTEFTPNAIRHAGVR